MNLPRISDDHDIYRRRRRLARAQRDVQLHAARQACPQCGHTSRLDGGNGCNCARTRLTERCAGIAAGRCYCLPDLEAAS